MVQFGSHLQDNALFPVLHRQYVFSIPKIIRNSFSLAKLSYMEKTGMVIYRSKMSHGGNKRNFQTFSRWLCRVHA